MIWTVLESFGAAEAGQVVVLALAALVFLPAPDMDLWAIRLLHHRSILTHAAHWPLLVLWAAPNLGLSAGQGVAAAAGAGLGVAVHLAADLLSPSRGYGRIWWPEPVQRSLGRWSPLWIAGNAVGAAWLGFALLPEAGALRVVAAVVGGLAALGYGVRRERSLLSALVALGGRAGGLRGGRLVAGDRLGAGLGLASGSAGPK
jgi:hypothetical protein